MVSVAVAFGARERTKALLEMGGGSVKNTQCGCRNARKNPFYPLFSPPLNKNDVARTENLWRCAFFRFASGTGGAVESEHTAWPRKTSLRFKIRSKNVLRAADCVYGRCDPPGQRFKALITGRWTVVILFFN